MQVPEQQSPRTTTNVIGKLSRARHNVFAARFGAVDEFNDSWLDAARLGGLVSLRYAGLSRVIVTGLL